MSTRVCAGACVYMCIGMSVCCVCVHRSMCKDAEAGSRGGERKACVRGSDHVGSTFRGRPVSVQGAQCVNTGSCPEQVPRQLVEGARCEWLLGVSDKPQDSHVCQLPFPHLEPCPLSPRALAAHDL